MPHVRDPGRLEEPCTLSQSDFDRFARLSGDHNPIHVDPAFAAATRFGATVSHGMLLFTRVRGLIERHYPGAVLLEQDLRFSAPSYAGETLRVALEATGPADPDGVLELVTEVVKADGRRGLEGRCRLRLPEAAR